MQPILLFLRPIGKQPSINPIEMKKTLLVLFGIIFTFFASAQMPPSVPKTTTMLDLSQRPADHLMIQYGYDIWTNRPDSVRTGGFSRHFNMYFMLDKPMKSNPKLSLGFGLGIGSSNMFFDKTYVDLKSTRIKLPFTNVDSTDHFRKFKITSIYIEAPIELRYYSNPEHPNSSWKAALGLKAGFLIKGFSKGKDYQTKNGFSIYGPTYIAKENDKDFFNPAMFAVTGRIGYGFISIDGGFQFNNVLRDGTGPNMNRITIGLTLSGL
jgi:hypothetical protein